MIYELISYFSRKRFLDKLFFLIQALTGSSYKDSLPDALSHLLLYFL